MSVSDIGGQYVRAKLDWREQLKRNKRRTFWVIVIFLCLYTFVGLLLDLFFLAPIEYQHKYQVSETFLQVFSGLGHQLQALVTFQQIPYLTIIFLVVGLVSVMISLVFHKRMMLLGTKYIEVKPGGGQNLQEETLWNVLEEMKISSGLVYVPKLFIIEASYMNAFASGWNQKSAMVVVTRGLLESLSRSELQAVVAHELSHIKNMDVRLILMVTLLSNIMLIVVDILFRSVLFSGGGRSSGKRDQGNGAVVLIVVILRVLLPIVTLLLILYLSRTRELMADSSCVAMMRDNGPLANALLKISTDYKENKQSYQDAVKRTAHEDLRRSAYLYDPNSAGIKGNHVYSRLFSTHPTLRERLAAIGFKPVDKTNTGQE